MIDKTVPCPVCGVLLPLSADTSSNGRFQYHCSKHGITTRSNPHALKRTLVNGKMLYLLFRKAGIQVEVGPKTKHLDSDTYFYAVTIKENRLADAEDLLDQYQLEYTRPQQVNCFSVSANQAFWM